MNSTTRKGLKGTQKVGSCQGSCIYHNIDCPKLQSEGICNINPKDFTFDNGAYICKSCGYYAVQIFCGCRKVTEFNKERNEIDVWYEGTHNCMPKLDAVNKWNYFETLPLRRDLHLTSTELRNDCVRFFMTTGQYAKALEVARMLNNKDDLEKMRFLQPGRKATHYCADIKEAFEIIKKLKTELDPIDKYWIYAFNCGSTSSEDLYVFKMSRHHLETALKMDAECLPLNGKCSILLYEKSYFDGMHKRVCSFKMLTLWLHHPGMRRMKRLASMDVDKENKDSVALFFCLFNAALQDFTGDLGYVFNPPMFMTDEAGAIHQGIQEVFGDGVLDKVSTCQWHFKCCAWRQLVNIRHSHRATFRDAVRGICKAKTAFEYELYAAQLDDICQKNNCTRWWNWWKVRQYYLVPALRGWGWMGTNWAEIGQSKMKPHRLIWLLDTLWEDILNAVTEEADWFNFINNTAKTIGHGPTLLAKRLNEVREMREVGASAIEAIRSACLQPDIDKHRDPAGNFLATSRAKHQTPMTFPKNNPTQSSAPAGRGRGKDMERVPLDVTFCQVSPQFVVGVTKKVRLLSWT